MRAAIFLLLVPSLLAGCGSLGRLDATKGHQATIKDYDRVVVGEFIASDERESRNEKSAEKQRAAIETGRKAFADLIEQELTKVGAFSEVSQQALAAPALKISGSIDQWKVGNVAARTLVGFVGGSGFEATVVVSDLESGEELARLRVNRNSWPLPIGSATNVLQSVEFFMQQGARRVAHELAKAKGLEVVEPDAEAAAPAR